jgi:hypothetical protein
MNKNVNISFEIQEAINDGYVHDFISLITGQLQCLTPPFLIYDTHNVSIEIVTCVSLPGVLLKITTLDNKYKGTLVSFFEDA